MAYVFFSLGVQVRRWPGARTQFQKATGTWVPSSSTCSHSPKSPYESVVRVDEPELRLIKQSGLHGLKGMIGFIVPYDGLLAAVPGLISVAFQQGCHRGGHSCIHTDITRVVFAESEGGSHLLDCVGALPIFQGSNLAGNGLAMPHANPVSNEFHFIERDGGFVRTSGELQRDHEVQDSSEVSFMGGSTSSSVIPSVPDPAMLTLTKGLAQSATGLRTSSNINWKDTLPFLHSMGITFHWRGPSGVDMAVYARKTHETPAPTAFAGTRVSGRSP